MVKDLTVPALAFSECGFGAFAIGNVDQYRQQRRAVVPSGFHYSHFRQAGFGSVHPDFYFGSFTGISRISETIPFEFTGIRSQQRFGRGIRKQYNAAMLAEALCKLEGFSYAPSDTVYWQQGSSTERDFIYVTTQTLGHDQLQQLSEEVGPERSLLVLCAAFRGKSDRWLNLTVKKIPNHIRARCEWGHDDYSLNVKNLPKAPPKPGQQDLFADQMGGRQ